MVIGFPSGKPPGGCKDNRKKKKKRCPLRREGSSAGYFKYNHLGAGHLEEEK